MKNKIKSLAIVACSLFSLTSCLDVDPVSSLTDKNMWQNEGHYTAFVRGVHTQLRDDLQNLFTLGELRCGDYSDQQSFSMESVTSLYCLNMLDEDNPGLTNYAGLYKNINQINLFISKAVATDLLPAKDRSYYLGGMYGLRAYYYFHLLRSWGDVIWNEEPSIGFEVGNLARPANKASEVMDNIKRDIQSSIDNFGSDYSFREQKSYWSKSASLMLKAEVYLWSSRQMGGGSADAQTALEALNDIKTNVSSLGLVTDGYSNVFAYDNKANKEMIFVIHHGENEYELFKSKWRDGMMPQNDVIKGYYDMETGTNFDASVINFGGRIFYPLKPEVYDGFDAEDTRRDVTLKAVYAAEEGHAYKGCFPYKYQGLTPKGATLRYMGDDFPIYRYADLLLFTAEAKSLSNGDPAAEINEIRKRAYAENYDEATVGYPHMSSDKDGIDEVLLRERHKEFMFEGKRWYDLRRFGNEYVFKYTTADSQHPKRLLWPIDKTTLTNNSALHQTDGYNTIYQ